jgi:hypothetical protein
VEFLTRYKGDIKETFLSIPTVGFEIMKSLEEIEGVWGEPEFASSLVLRCHAARKKPIDRLSDLELASLLNQDIGVEHILPEAIRRIERNKPDDTELFDGQLIEAVERKREPNQPTGGDSL